MAADHSDIRKQKKNSVQQEEPLPTRKSKIRQFLSPSISQPAQQVRSAPQSPVRRKKVVSVAYLDELQKHINSTPPRPALPSYSGPRSSPRPRPPRPPPYNKSAPNIVHPAPPTSPSIPPRSTISKKADFRKDKGIYVCPISPTKGASPSKASPIKKLSFDNPPQKVSSAPPLRRQDDITNSFQLTKHGNPALSSNVHKQSTHDHIYTSIDEDDEHDVKLWRSKGGSLSFDSHQFTEDGYEYIDEFMKLHDKRGAPLYSNVTDESVMKNDSNGYLVLCKSSSADDTKNFEDEEEDPYSYARIDDFLKEKGETAGASDDKDVNYGYEALHYRQLSI